MLIDDDPRELFATFVDDCRAVGLDHEWIATEARTAVDYYRDPKRHPRSPVGEMIERTWYEALDSGDPWYEVYGTDAYVADLWGCWQVYSRQYLRSIRAQRSLPERGGVVADLEGVESIVDLGCGIGYSTAALAQLFPRARVVGTNISDLSQTRICERVAERYGFEIEPAAREHFDLVFASEYFEHFQTPIVHLVDVLDQTTPRALLVANCFGGRSIGHFDCYLLDDGSQLFSDALIGDGRATGRAFGRALRSRGYALVATKLWNNRPAYWRAA